jgi:F420-dependent oxidoreductase-like protein
MGRLGYRTPDKNYGYTPQEIIETAQLAERHGYDSLWYPEWHGRDAFVALAELAHHTDTIRLGTGITPVFARVPAQIAMAAATLDEMSGGRVNLGIGASSPDTVEHWYGIPYERPLRRVRETIEIVRLAHQNERVSYDGDLFTLSNYPHFYDTVQDEIPIYNAAIGEKNIELTGRFADGWLPVNIPMDRFPDLIDDLHDAARAAGRDPEALTVAPYIWACVAEDRDLARRKARVGIAFYIGAMAYYRHVFTDFGYGDAVEAIHEAWRAGDPEAALDRVPDDLLDAVAIAGTPEEGRERLREYRDLGVDLPIIYPPRIEKELIDTTLVELSSY